MISLAARSLGFGGFGDLDYASKCNFGVNLSFN